MSTTAFDASVPAGATRRLQHSFSWLWTSAGSANLADGIYQVALPIAALHNGGGPAAVAAVFTASRLPWALVALHVGVLVDRMDRRLLLVAANLGRTAALLAGAVVLATGTGGVAALIAVAFVLGVAETVGDTSMHSLTPRVVGTARLERANSRMQATELITQLFAGPSLGGILAGLAVGWAFGAVALLYAAAAIAALRVVQSAPPTADTADRRRPQVRDGLRFLFARPTLAAYAIGVGLLNTAFGAFQAAMPIVALHGPLGLSAGEYGLLLGCTGISGLAAGLGAPALLRRAGNRTALLIGVIGLAVGIGLPGLSASLPLVVTGLLCAGLMVFINVVTASYRQRTVPDHLLGRVTAAYRLLAYGGFPLGSALAGVLGAAASPATVLVTASALTLLTGAVMTVMTPTRQPSVSRVVNHPT